MTGEPGKPKEYNAEIDTRLSSAGTSNIENLHALEKVEPLADTANEPSLTETLQAKETSLPEASQPYSQQRLNSGLLKLKASTVVFPPPPTKLLDTGKPPAPSKNLTQTIEDWIVQVEGAFGDETKTQNFIGDQDVSLILISDFLLSDYASDKPELVERIYETLTHLVRSADENRTRFVIELYPTLIWRHFVEYTRRTYQSEEISSGLQVLFLTIYTLGTTKDNGYNVQTFVLPSVSCDSVYHKTGEIPKKVASYINQQVSLTGHRVPVQVFKDVEKITRSSRWPILNFMVHSLNQCLAHCSGQCHKSIITVSQRLLQNSLGHREELLLIKEKEDPKRQNGRKNSENIVAALQTFKPNFDKIQAHFDLLKDRLLKSPAFRGADRATLPGYHLDSRFLVEWTNLLYTLMYQGYFDESYALTKDIQREAEYRMLPDALLVTSAILSRAETTISAPSYDELLPRVDLELAEAARRDLQRDIAMAAQNGYITTPKKQPYNWDG